MRDEPTLDCQDCGNSVRKLTPAEAQQVAANPYNYVVWCTTCQRARALEAGSTAAPLL